MNSSNTSCAGSKLHACDRSPSFDGGVPIGLHLLSLPLARQFLALQPPQILQNFSEADIRWWFNSADTNGNGTVSVNEFFTWSLRNASEKYGTNALEQAFGKYDKDNTGHLDRLEFTKAANDMGFGVMAETIFRSIDSDDSGTISYKELFRSLSEAVPSDPTTKQMLNALMWTYNKPVDNAHARYIDTSGWEIKGNNATAVRIELLEHMRHSGAHVADLIRLFDIDAGTMSIDLVEFIAAMREKLHYTGSNKVLEEVFRSMDTDGSGDIGFDEMYEFVRGRRHSLDRRSRALFDIPLVPPEGLSHDEVAWDAEVLRVLIKRALEENHAGPADLLRKWARRGACDSKRGLTLPAFTAGVYHIFFAKQDPDLWENEVVAAVHDSFQVMMGLVRGENFLRQVGLQHFEAWLRMPATLTIEKLPRKSMAQLRSQRARREETRAARRRMEAVRRKQALAAQQRAVNASPVKHPKTRSPRPLHGPTARHLHKVLSEPELRAMHRLKGLDLPRIEQDAHVLLPTAASKASRPKPTRQRPATATRVGVLKPPPPQFELQKLQHALTITATSSMFGSTASSINFYAPLPTPDPTQQLSWQAASSVPRSATRQRKSSPLLSRSRPTRPSPSAIPHTHSSSRRPRTADDRVYDNLMVEFAEQRPVRTLSAAGILSRGTWLQGLGSVGS